MRHVLVASARSPRPSLLPDGTQLDPTGQDHQSARLTDHDRTSASTMAVSTFPQVTWGIAAAPPMVSGAVCAGSNPAGGAGRRHFSNKQCSYFAKSITQARNAWSQGLRSPHRPARTMRRGHAHDRHAREIARFCGLFRKDPDQLHRPAESATADNDACLARPAVQLRLAESHAAQPTPVAYQE
jgi:hypothetical protein